jgi:predicted ATP-grasp superfamily ATP-dependent carboligase
MWPSSLGNSTVCKSVSLSDIVDLKKTIVRYLLNIGYHGIFSVEFKKDSRDNIGKLLEVNARSWWYNSFPSSCGVNIIFIAYLNSIGENIKVQKNYQIDKKLIYSIDELKWMFNRILKGEFSFQEWYSSLNGKRDWALFNREDLRPLIMKMLKMIKLTIAHPRRFTVTIDDNTQYFR